MPEVLTESSSISTSASTDNRRLILRRLGEHVAEIEGFIRGLNEAQLKERPSPDRCSIHELVLHLVERQDVFVERFAQMLEKDRPPIQPYQANKKLHSGFYLSRSFTFQFRVYREQRENLLALLRYLDNTQWLREGEHPSIRHYTVEKCMESLMRYEEYCLNELFNLFFGADE